MPTIEVSEETLGKLKEQFAGEFIDIDINSLEDMKDQKWFFRTVTVYLLGRVKKQVGKFIVLEDASWIADTKRFSNFIKDGISEDVEVEPVGRVMLNIDSVVDAYQWQHQLPTKQQ